MKSTTTDTLDYITTFFAEKNLDDRIYEVESANGTLNLISTANVIEKIGLTKNQERKQIEGILRQIDFRNGDVHHFMNHLAQAMAIDF